MTKLLALFGLAICAFSSSAFAEQVIHYREGDRIDPLEVAKVLGKQQPQKIRTRSLRLMDDPAVPVLAEKRAEALSIPVRFAFNSAEIQPGMKQQLDAIAEGIKLMDSQTPVVVEGHTDAVGSDAYNLELSQRRAAAVKFYLVNVHGIEPARLQHIGFGKYRPIEGADPFAPENRRVQFRSAM
ncbi:MAG TPA: OmpA family protein [Burkholderiaceae bacterium]|nr:OmpA family protein [Burkholderiaceae bacterium]